MPRGAPPGVSRPPPMQVSNNPHAPLESTFFPPKLLKKTKIICLFSAMNRFMAENRQIILCAAMTPVGAEPTPSAPAGSLPSEEGTAQKRVKDFRPKSGPKCLVSAIVAR